ncbi:phosphatase PAP2 family protein [Ramlibacter sp.]|uniref:phosphatase PAP2 family protein n=1 Tax=Ramlibacter sp. TaxID=1917967 RepID=UPI002C6F39D1|nr:phosphatase PAP2 family protein [Ramlibacter sp.]HWI84107.1 phosphatase PAP2 family protein [Ramlibacter sp.]
MPAADPLPRPRAAIALPLLAAGCAVFALLAADLLLHGPVTAADAGISRWFHAHAGAAVTGFLQLVSDVHSTRAILLMAALALIALLWRRQFAWAPALVLCVPGGMLLNTAVKDGFQRARPALEGVTSTLGSYSFPSGHTAGATVWWGFALVWVFAHCPLARERATAAAVAVLLVLLTALSRVVLGAHYLSDVLAAMAEGAAWLGLCFALLAHAPWERARRR